MDIEKSSKLLEGLNYVIQFRRKEQIDYDPWHTMAAFDALGPAQWYFDMQGNDMWEYQLIDLVAGTAVIAEERGT